MNCRTVIEIKESEQRAHAQAKILQAALDEHSLELRVRAANEAEAACQQRLSAAEAEMAELRAKMDASQRFSILCNFETLIIMLIRPQSVASLVLVD